MFTNKQSTLQPKKAQAKSQTSATTNAFINAGMKNQAETLSGNGALKYKTTGNVFTDQFGKVGEYKKPRDFKTISADCELQWANDKLTTVKFMHYLRTIPRIVDLGASKKTSTPQAGAELKHEAIFRMIWLAIKAPETFKKNLQLFIALGSWKDVITMLSYDLQWNGWDGRVLDWGYIGRFILSGLEDKGQNNLIKKFLPNANNTSQSKTLSAQADRLIARWICSLVFGKSENPGDNFAKYRRLKTSGTAHEWQKLISQKKFDRIDFNSIHGRALHLLVKSKFLKNQNLSDKYNAWISKPETEAKFTGFVNELFANLPDRYRLDASRRDTINKQFETLIKKGGESEITPLIVVRDTSGSMSSTAVGTNMSSGDIAKAIALYFSYFLKGAFQDCWIEFNHDAQMHRWNGNTPLDKWYNDTASYVGNTNFQKVIQMFCKLKLQGIPEDQFPKGILCISDGEFDSSSLGETNVQTARKSLAQAGFSKEYVDNFVIALWNIPNGYYGAKSGTKFETFGDTNNVFYFSGYSASVVKFLTSKIKNTFELFDAAMDQEVLNLIQL